MIHQDAITNAVDLFEFGMLVDTNIRNSNFAEACHNNMRCKELQH